MPDDRQRNQIPRSSKMFAPMVFLVVITLLVGLLAYLGMPDLHAIRCDASRDLQMGMSTSKVETLCGPWTASHVFPGEPWYPLAGQKSNGSVLMWRYGDLSGDHVNLYFDGKNGNLQSVQIYGDPK